MSAFFVTATGTDIGKTFVTAGLIATLRRRGRTVEALKPVASGFDAADAGSSDPGVLLAALGQAATDANLARIAPWRFAAALSPDMAAAREGCAIDFSALTAFTAAAIAARRDVLFIEGVGGIMVPLTDNRTTLDWMVAAKLPLIVVAGSYLGTISHTLSAVDVVLRRGLQIAALVVNESPASPVPVSETAATIARHVGATVSTLPRGAAAGHPAFDHLADLVLAAPA